MRLPRMLCDEPRVYLFEGFARPHETELVLQLTRDLDALAAAGVDVNRSVAGRSFELPVAVSPVLQRLQRRIHHALGLGNRLGATMRFRRYEPGEHHPLHNDSYEAEGATLIATALLCLCTTASGGETRFPYAKGGALAVAPRRGNLLAWFSHRPDGVLDARAEHEGNAVREGVKITLTEFLYEPVARAAAQPRHVARRR